MTRTISLAAVFMIASMCGASAQTLKLDRLTASPGDRVSLSTTGFQGPVDVYFDTTDQHAGTSGNSLSVQIPASAIPGKHWLTVVDRKSGDAARAALTVSADWREYGFGTHGTRYNNVENVINKRDVSRLALAWKSMVGRVQDLVVAPIVVANSLYVTGDGKLRAFDRDSGAALWTVSGIASQPAGDNGVIYAGSSDKKLYAFDAATGAVLWSSIATGNIIDAPPIVVKGVVYVGSEDGYFYAFNARTGTVLWSSKVTPLGIANSAASDKGVVYVMAESGAISAFDTQTGVPLWSNSVQGDVLSNGVGLIARDGVVYVSTSFHIYDFDAVTGMEIGVQSMGINGSSPALAHGILYSGQVGDLMEAYSGGAHGRLLWATLIDQNIETSPAVANGLVFAGCLDGNLYAFNAKTGEKLWSASTGSSRLNGAVTVANGMVYVTSYEGFLYAYALDGGKDPVYRRDTQPPLFSQLHPERN